MLKQYLNLYNEAVRVGKNYLRDVIINELEREGFQKTQSDRINFNTSDLKVIKAEIVKAITVLAAPAKISGSNITVFEADKASANQLIDKPSRSFPNYIISVNKKMVIGTEEIPAGTVTYVINNFQLDKAGVGSTLHGGKLKPDSINIAGIDLQNADDLKKRVTKALSIGYDDNVKLLCTYLMNDIKKVDKVERKRNKIDFKGAPTTTAILLSPATIKIFNLVNETDLNTISKNFGEALGGLLFFYKYSADKVFFPVSGSHPLVDFIVDDVVNISSKAGQGAPPSIENISKKIKELQIKNKTDIQIPKLASDLITTMADTSAAAGYWHAAQRIKPNIYNLILEHIELSNNDTSLDNIESTITSVQNDITDFINKKYKSLKGNDDVRVKKMIQYLKETFWDEVGYTRFDENVAKTVITSSSNKSGLLLAPITRAVVDKLNSKPEYVEGLNTIAQSLGVKQLYFEFKLPGKRNAEASPVMIFSLKDFGTENFKYALKGGGMDNWSKGRMTFSMV